MNMYYQRGPLAVYNLVDVSVGVPAEFKKIAR